jgi:glycosyltransferase involved in cell wall biosynthesis
MDRDVPPRVTYWTGVWAPDREAISKQVAGLRQALGPRSPVVSFSSGQRSSLLPRDRIVRLSGRRMLALRALAMMIEPHGDVTHAIGSLSSWHFLRVLGRRPLLLTVALPGQPIDSHLYDRVGLFAAESERLASAVLALGVPRERVQVIYPPVDLMRFVPRPAPTPRPFRLVFASTPADRGEIESRGILLLVEVARRLPDIEIVVPWRRWDTGFTPEAALSGLDLPRNFTVLVGNRADMESVYAEAHATICAFADGFGKSCPNSLIEGLACGRPAVVTDTCGISDLIQDASAGVVAARTVDDLTDAIERLRRSWSCASVRARLLAERCFNQEQTHRRYAEIYSAMAAGRRSELRE